MYKNYIKLHHQITRILDNFGCCCGIRMRSASHSDTCQFSLYAELLFCIPHWECLLWYQLYMYMKRFGSLVAQSIIKAQYTYRKFVFNVVSENANSSANLRIHHHTKEKHYITESRVFWTADDSILHRIHKHTNDSPLLCSITAK